MWPPNLRLPPSAVVQDFDQVEPAFPPLLPPAQWALMEDQLRDANNVSELFHEDLKGTDVFPTLTSVC